MAEFFSSAILQHTSSPIFIISCMHSVFHTEHSVNDLSHI